ncbi:hypothetical protein T265_06935 [Opisthorchis viverrini]|uniref:Uncharacterized protein n=1 Tax=Opisthorchis viverrini TaxID=6198 RepID=A0A074ZEG1_OPIVI|nr:hypothetical protein T265_06935 [Opisthorchis viverrini]KER25646.1 hypothetical protein T265_06935 [Opisthorchis viverrini]
MLAYEPTDVVDNKFVYLSSCISPGGLAKDDISVLIERTRTAILNIKFTMLRCAPYQHTEAERRGCQCLTLGVFEALRGKRSRQNNHQRCTRFINAQNEFRNSCTALRIYSVGGYNFLEFLTRSGCDIGNRHLANTGSRLAAGPAGVPNSWPVSCGLGLSAIAAPEDVRYSGIRVDSCLTVVINEKCFHLFREEQQPPLPGYLNKDNGVDLSRLVIGVKGDDNPSQSLRIAFERREVVTLWISPVYLLSKLVHCFISIGLTSERTIDQAEHRVDSTKRKASEKKDDRSAVAPFRCLAAMQPEGSTRSGIQPGCPSLDRGSREAEVGFEPRTFRSVNSRPNHFGYLTSCRCCRRSALETSKPRDSAGFQFPIRCLNNLVRLYGGSHLRNLSHWALVANSTLVRRNTLPVRLLKTTRQSTNGFTFAGGGALPKSLFYLN